MEEKQTFDGNETLRADTPAQMDVDMDGAEPSKKDGTRARRRRIILFSALGLLLVLGVLVGVRVHRILNKPETMFAESVANVTEPPQEERMEPAFDLSAYSTPGASPEQENSDTAALAADATADASPEPAETAALTDNIVNILLMGIDAFEDGGTTSGTQPHTDVMMVVAVNFDKDTVDLITLPRDTFTTAPGYHGFYKLNGVFNAGGGMDDLEGGFALTCRAAEIWLGGISIPYYYALDFKAVVDIVNAIGGIDYDVDQPFEARKLGLDKMTRGRHYSLGMHHLDGDAVLTYLRIRHTADGLDSSRTARQRRMMVAIFKKLKTEGKLSQVPDLINAASSGIYTNTTLSQTTALVNYAMNSIEPEQIRTRSMYGDIWYQHYFKYCFVDQQNRIDLIKEVFNIDAEPVGVNTPQFENWLYDIGFLAMKHVRQPEKVFTVIQQRKDAGETFTEEQIAAYAACYHAYVALDEGFAACSARVQKAYVDTSLTEEQIEALEAEVKEQLEKLNRDVKNTTTALQKIFDTHVRVVWTVGTRWFVDQDINEKFVAFG